MINELDEFLEKTAFVDNAAESLARYLRRVGDAGLNLVTHPYRTVSEALRQGNDRRNIARVDRAAAFYNNMLNPLDGAINTNFAIPEFRLTDDVYAAERARDLDAGILESINDDMQKLSKLDKLAFVAFDLSLDGFDLSLDGIKDAVENRFSETGKSFLPEGIGNKMAITGVGLGIGGAGVNALKNNMANASDPKGYSKMDVYGEAARMQAIENAGKNLLRKHSSVSNLLLGAGALGLGAAIAGSSGSSNNHKQNQPKIKAVNTGDNAKKTVGNAAKPVGNAGSNAKKPVGNAGSNAKKPVGNTGSNAKKPVGNTGSNAKKPVGNAANPVSDQIKDGEKTSSFLPSFMQNSRNSAAEAMRLRYLADLEKQKLRKNQNKLLLMKELTARGYLTEENVPKIMELMNK